MPRPPSIAPTQLRTSWEFHMRYLRPYDLDALEPGTCGDWLLAPGDGAGVTVRLSRGGGEAVPRVSETSERFALVLRGTAHLVQGGVALPAATGELAFIPAGCSGAFAGDAATLWAEIETELTAGTGGATGSEFKVMHVDQSKFEGAGFAYQSLIDRTQGAHTMRANVLQVQPGAGSPDWHIHAFSQIYFIQEGNMTVDIGRARFVARADTLVFLPAGVVHRNFNASNDLERHVSLLVPEPKSDEIFDFAITIHEHEAELLTAIPANLSTCPENSNGQAAMDT